MHVRRALAVALAVPLLLAGCTDESDPEPKIPDPTTSSPTDEPTETETPEGESPEDFVRRWVEVGDEMQVTGDTNEYRSMIDKSCKACATFLGSVEEIYEGDGSIEFAGSKVNRIARREEEPPTFALTKTLPETIIQRGGGADPETLPAGKTTLLVILRSKSDSWVVRYYGVL